MSQGQKGLQGTETILSIPSQPQNGIDFNLLWFSESVKKFPKEKLAAITKSTLRDRNILIFLFVTDMVLSTCRILLQYFVILFVSFIFNALLFCFASVGLIGAINFNYLQILVCIISEAIVFLFVIISNVIEMFSSKQRYEILKWAAFNPLYLSLVIYILNIYYFRKLYIWHTQIKKKKHLKLPEDQNDLKNAPLREGEYPNPPELKCDAQVSCQAPDNFEPLAHYPATRHPQSQENTLIIKQDLQSHVSKGDPEQLNHLNAEPQLKEDGAGEHQVCPECLNKISEPLLVCCPHRTVCNECSAQMVNSVCALCLAQKSQKSP